MHYSYAGYDTIELATTYMHRESIHSQWDIGLIQAIWIEDDFPDDSPTTVVSQEIVSEDSNCSEWQPDVAYDPENGNIHVVWTGFEEHQYPMHQWRVHHNRLDRATQTWDGDVEVCEWNRQYSGWAPRIAIGNAGSIFDGDIVGIVYSSYTEQEGHYATGHWSCSGAWWDVDNEGPEDAEFMHFSYDDSEPAGFPRLDLAPRSTGAANGYGSIAYTQCMGYNESTARDEFAIVEINTERLSSWVIEEGETYDEGIFGAIAIHDGTNPLEASLSYMLRVDEEEWDVVAGVFEMDDAPPSVTWTTVDSGIGGAFDFETAVDYLLIEPFQQGDIVTFPESSSGDYKYWLGYCDTIDTSAHTVYVAYGDAT